MACMVYPLPPFLVRGVPLERTGRGEFTKLASDMATAYGSGDWEGDRDSWPEAIDDATWRQLTVNHRQCTGRRCGHFSACAFFRSRRELELRNLSARELVVEVGGQVDQLVSCV
jgi:Rad3-related DNA helicase